MRRASIASALALGLLGLLAPTVGASHEFEYVAQTTKFFMRNSAAGCPGTPFLDIEAGSAEPGCGYVGGAPFGELYHAGAPVASTIKVYATQDEVARYLDPSKDIAGNVRVVATATTNRMAVGQIRVDVTVRGTDTSGSSIVLGTSSSTKTVDPTNSAEVDFPFTMDVAAALDKAQLNQVRVDVDIRGWHVLTGYHRLNGLSWFDLPTFDKRPIQHV